MKNNSQRVASATSVLKLIYPIALWLVLFSTCKYIPSSIRPLIHVKLLPFADSLLFTSIYGVLLLSILSLIVGVICFRHLTLYQKCWFALAPLSLSFIGYISSREPNSTMDALMFLPYGIFHYLSPIVFIFICYYTDTTDLIYSYCHALGWMNVAGVVTQILIPCAAPWYNDKMGIQAANYSMPGDPAGLKNVDKLFGTQIYTSVFNSSPLVFGALPSLHSAMAVLFTMFCFKVSTRLGSVMLGYTAWMWMSTIYFRHHYMFDLYVGAVYAAVAFSIQNRKIVNATTHLLPLHRYKQIPSNTL
ncbi:hypothetical protein BC833DRAFT_574739 [Globomyces pollinis-pini]|nr:hypothetical protein BC833DRAFT_574739 [Globomyces pollinis-pini]